MKKKTKETIGWREWVSLPELGVDRIKAKVDTGARTSALHAEDIKVYRRGNKRFVKFTIYPLQRNKKVKLVAKAPIVEKRSVKSSVGRVTNRYVIETTLQVGENSCPIELTLVNRDVMGFRMLLGREAVRGRYLVDAGKSYLSSKNIPTRKYSRKPKAKARSRAG